MIDVYISVMMQVVDQKSVTVFFFFQAEDGIRDRSVSRGLGDVYKRQDYRGIHPIISHQTQTLLHMPARFC